MNHNISKLAAAVALALTLSACGGSGDDNSASTSDKLTPSAKISIKAMDGYLVNAQLCADENNDGLCQQNEKIKDINGKDVKTAKHGLINANISLQDKAKLDTFPNLIVVTPETNDEDFNGVQLSSYTLSTPKSSVVASPITDLVVIKMQQNIKQGVADNEATEKAENELIKLFIDNELIKKDDVTFDLYADYIAEKSKNETYRKLHQLAQILANSKAMAVKNGNSSLALFVDNIDNIIIKAINIVNGKDQIKIDDPRTQVSIPVTAEGDVITIVNHIAKFDNDKINTIQLPRLQGDKSLWENVEITLPSPLVIDPDNQDINFEISNNLDLNKANLQVEKNNDKLIISRVDNNKEVAGGKYAIIFTAQDINSQKFKQGAVSAKVAFDVINEAHIPNLNNDTKSTIQTDINKLNLEVGIEVNEVYPLDNLFNDLDDDSLIYSATTNLSGVTAKVDGTELTLSGTPSSSPKNSTITVSVTDGLATPSVSFSLPPVTPVYENKLRDKLLANSTWYRWVYNNELNQAVCQGFKFEDGSANNNQGTMLFAEGEICPKEDDMAIHGKWHVDANGDFTWNVKDKNVVLNGLLFDLTSENHQKRIKTLEQDIAYKPNVNAEHIMMFKANNSNHAVTYFANVEAANDFWQFGDTKVWLNNKLVNLSTSAYENEFQNEKIIVVHLDLASNCQDLGFKKNEIQENEKFLSYASDNLYVNGFDIYSKEKRINISKGSVTAFSYPNKSNQCTVNFVIDQNETNSLKLASGDSLVIHPLQKLANSDEDFIIKTQISQSSVEIPLMGTEWIKDDNSRKLSIYWNSKREAEITFGDATGPDIDVKAPMEDVLSYWPTCMGYDTCDSDNISETKIDHVCKDETSNYDEDPWVNCDSFNRYTIAWSYDNNLRALVAKHFPAKGNKSGKPYTERWLKQ